MARFFITGIGTGIGKTIVSAIVTEALQADYWKPIQSGLEEATDSQIVQKLISNTKTVIHPEAFRLRMPASPHAAAEAENVKINSKNIVLPITSNNLVIEGAGGLMVPLNEKELMIDLIKTCDAKVILVVRHYLGSINHTLLSVEALKKRKLPIAGIVYNGQPNPSSESIITTYCKLPVIGRIGEEKEFTPATVLNYTERIKQSLSGLL